jgi:large subunit ribosomal protein L3
VDNCEVTYVKTKGNEGYDAVQVACSDQKPHRVTKPLLKHFEKAGVSPKKKVVEFQVTPDALIPVGKGAFDFCLISRFEPNFLSGTMLNAAHFVPGQFIDVAGKSWVPNFLMF